MNFFLLTEGGGCLVKLVAAVHHFSRVLDYSNIVISVVPNIYQKFNYITCSYVYIFQYEHLKRFI